MLRRESAPGCEVGGKEHFGARQEAEDVRGAILGESRVHLDVTDEEALAECLGRAHRVHAYEEKCKRESHRALNGSSRAEGWTVTGVGAGSELGEAEGLTRAQLSSRYLKF
jgi:hypothetical protein